MMKYATIWQRILALMVDAAVILPLVILCVWLEGYSRTLAYLMFFSHPAFTTGYRVYCHGRFGKTIGKYLIGITVLQISGGRITWRQAWLRCSVDLGFGILNVAALYIALSNTIDANYFGHNWMERFEYLSTLKPFWAGWVSKAGRVWIMSEVIVMLLNNKRRALHDFIAGTIVVADDIKSEKYVDGKQRLPFGK